MDVKSLELEYKRKMEERQKYEVDVKVYQTNLEAAIKETLNHLKSIKEMLQNLDDEEIKQQLEAALPVIPEKEDWESMDTLKRLNAENEAFSNLCSEIVMKLLA